MHNGMSENRIVARKEEPIMSHRPIRSLKRPHESHSNSHHKIARTHKIAWTHNIPQTYKIGWYRTVIGRLKSSQILPQTYKIRLLLNGYRTVEVIADLSDLQDWTVIGQVLDG